MANRYFIELSYDGTAYHGWQIQPNAKTIQETLNTAISTVIRKEIYTVGCGRTDTGVHAKQFIAHFDLEENAIAFEDLIFRCNGILPKDISVHHLYPVKDDAHARFSALARSYEYHICNRKDPFAINRKWELRDELDLTAMNAASQQLLGEHDFSSFSKSNTQTETNLCHVQFANWCETSDGICFEVKANRFLRNMVRALVGTLVEVGRGKSTIADFKAIMNAKNRSEAGVSVPAHGLYLSEVTYPKEIRIHE